MKLSKKEISILIEIIFSILFAFIFMPFFYKNQETQFALSDLASKIIEILIFVIIYFSITYTLLEIYHKNKMVEDERNGMINSKSYKVGYLLYELSLFIFIGLLINSPINYNGGVIFYILLLTLIVSLIKSIYQFYLHRIF
ncbi:MAG: hypothetical protein P8L23_00670 [Flavobacteriales bacterium]|nr:hypothetical protein [Flavobacteriales bacterium]